MNESFWAKLKMVKGRDLCSFFLFLLAILPAAVLKRIRPGLWLICEQGTEARDNGYWFFRYLRTEHPAVDAVYAIDRNSPEYQKVASLGPTVQQGSLKHWIYYLACRVNVSSMKQGKPNAAIGYLLEVLLGIVNPCFVFLQHGIIKDDIPSLHKEKCAFSLFICGAEPEYDYVKSTFGYEEGVVCYTGLARFDGLYGIKADTDLVLIVPTWRMYLHRKGDALSAEEFQKTAYYKAWSSLLADGRLDALLAKYGKRAVFCLHRNMEAFEGYFASSSERIRVVPWQQADIGSLLRNAGHMITDYSSVAMDFAYMKKPLAYYQFDQEEFRAGHLPTGYFDYQRDGFGPVCTGEDALLQALEKIFAGDTSGEEYLRRIDSFYTIRDDQNCRRIYDAACEMLKKQRR
ncbi:MAG: CDP-glycerol glycerophosphotransferase family protein [Firmicutes bacterium]|nr:CDP-glycerol glycerophosphotransferase family protein [Bacillota bacterium]